MQKYTYMLNLYTYIIDMEKIWGKNCSDINMNVQKSTYLCNSAVKKILKFKKKVE